MNELGTALARVVLVTLLQAAGAGAPGAPVPPAPAAAPTPSPVPSPSPSPAAQDKDEYTIGSGDVLEVMVYGNDDLTRAPTVQTNGTITLPLVGEITARGKTPSELREELTRRLQQDWLVNPQVEVKVREFNSQFATVLGEVNTPGRKALRGRTRLIDVLIDAGGLRPSASGEIALTRSEGEFEQGQKTLRVHVGTAGPAGLELAVRNGDVVTAEAKNYVNIAGEVSRPGRYTLESNLTVYGLITTAGGLTRFGGKTVTLSRLVAGDATKREVVEVDLGDILKGEAADIVLQPNDIVSVPRRLF